MQAFFTLVVVLISCTTLVFSTNDACGDTGKRCIKGRSKCTDGQCVCIPPYTETYGGPEFNCYRENRVAAEVRKDPSFTNFRNETVDFPFLCRYLLTHVRQELKDRDKNVIGSCEIKVHAFNAKDKGKFYPNGYDIALRISYNNGTVVEMTERKYGVAKLGNLKKVTKMGTFGAFLKDGSKGTDSIEYIDTETGVKVLQYENPDNDEVGLVSKKCGVRIILRPYDRYLRRHQRVVPGISVDLNCGNHPVFLSHNKVLAQAPHRFGGTSFFDKENYLMEGLTPSQTTLVRAYVYNTAQTQPGGRKVKEQCERGAHIFQACGEFGRKKAFEFCEWMLKRPLFIKCYDSSSSGYRILDLFNLCVEGWCGYPGSCEEAVSKVNAATNCNHLKNTPEFYKFRDGLLCPHL